MHVCAVRLYFSLSLNLSFSRLLLCRFYLFSLYTATFPISLVLLNNFLWVSLSHKCQTNATTTKYRRAFKIIDFNRLFPIPHSSASHTQLISIVQNSTFSSLCSLCFWKRSVKINSMEKCLFPYYDFRWCKGHWRISSICSHSKWVCSAFIWN